MPDALDRDPSRSRAVLIGTWDYRHLEPAPAAEHSLNRMAALLRSPLCGNWPSDRVSVIGNRNTLGTLPHELVTSLRAAEDVALFYYVGRSQYDSDDRLCLALADSRSDAALRTTTSLTFDAVRHAFKVSRAATKIAILDCCFAGLAAGRDSALAWSGAQSLPSSPGCYLLMANGESPASWCEPDNGNPRPQTYFTGRLADVIEEGIPGRPTGLTLGVIFEAVSDALARDGRHEPGSRVSDHAASHVFARNAAAQRATDAVAVPQGGGRQVTRSAPRGRARAAKARRRWATAAAVTVTMTLTVTSSGGGKARTPAAKPESSTTQGRADPAAVVAALPAVLRQRVSCDAYSAANPTDLSCTIKAGDPVFGDLLQPGSGEYPFSVTLESDSAWYAHQMRQSYGHKLIQTAPKVVAIDDSQGKYVGVDYLDPRTGLHLTLWDLSSRQSAQTFLTRSGLTDGGT
ncbi:caspase family protein [Streptomyces roseoverticillatus]|uniref:caspase, EACC1-associated type n=1 Tax=Streptomyces roseoverticillatus TaxID=66429 RepID=UPI001F3262F9|nr:caspase family protein [Streptomyces roseoverticillatus]MCF3104856.1 caspase family protein [Streptomyces roseoverticillatus]